MTLSRLYLRLSRVNSLPAESHMPLLPWQNIHTVDSLAHPSEVPDRWPVAAPHILRDSRQAAHVARTTVRDDLTSKGISSLATPQNKVGIVNF